MRKLFLTLLLIGSIVCAKSQNHDTTTHAPSDTSKTFYRVEVEPSYPGGVSGLFMYIAKNEKSVDSKGVVRISFTIERDGGVSDIKVDQSLSERADKEAIRLVSGMRKWRPGMQGGHPVRVRYSIPIKFPME